MKKLKLLVISTVFLASLLSATSVSAKASAIAINSADGKVYEYNFDNLKKSAEIYAISDAGDKDAKLYSDFFVRKFSIKAYYDDTKKAYIDADVVNNAAITGIISEPPFEFKTFLEAAATPTIILTPNKITVDDTGNILINGQSPLVDLATLKLNTTLLPNTTIATFKLDVSDPVNYNVTVKGSTAKFNDTNNIFVAVMDETLTTANFVASDFVVTSKSIN